MFGHSSWPFLFNANFVLSNSSSSKKPNDFDTVFGEESDEEVSFMFVFGSI